MTRDRIAELLKFQPSFTSPTIEVIENEETDRFYRKLIKYESAFNDEVLAYLLEPKSAPNGWGVVVYHQHASQWHIGKSEPAGLCGDPYNQFGPALASVGTTVICPDCVGFEDRRRIGKGVVEHKDTDWLQYYNGIAYRLVMGNYLITEILADYDLSLNILINHDFVENDCVGALGHSFGGNTVIFHAALDSRIQLACASGSACTVKTKMERETGLEMSHLIPGFFKEFDIDDLIECIAPRKLLLISGADDQYSLDAEKIYQESKQKWIQANAPDNIKHISFDGGHNLDRERFDVILNWLVSHFRNKISGV